MSNATKVTRNNLHGINNGLRSHLSHLVDSPQFQQQQSHANQSEHTGLKMKNINKRFI